MVINIKEVFKNLKALSYETLEAWKYFFIIFIVVDLFGIYWYLKLKKFGVALLIVCLIALAVILFLERNKRDELPDEKPSKEDEERIDRELRKYEVKNKKSKPKPPEEPQTPMEEPSMEDFGLPDSGEYNRRLEKAIGSF